MEEAALTDGKRRMSAVIILFCILCGWIAYSAYFASKFGDAPLVEWIIGIFAFPPVFAAIAFWGFRVRLMFRLSIAVIAGLAFLFSFETTTRFGASLGYPYFQIEKANQ